MTSRVGRATIQSLQSTAKLSYYLSPWGDNNPVTLPNIRRRDFVFAGVMHIVIETLAPSAVTVIEKSIQEAAEITIEEAADLGINIWDGKNSQKVKRRVGLDTLEFRIAHKSIGEEANRVLHDERKAVDKRSCAKGWFGPYLYCSGRSTSLERSKDFAIAELRGLGLAADASIAPILLASFVETATPIVYLCPWELTHPTYPSLMEADTRRRWKSTVGETVQAMLDAALSVPDAIRATAVGHCELERAGFVMFRY